MDELKKLRNDLDMCDEILIDALRMRCQIIQEITNYKQKNGLPIYQAEEEERKKSKMLAKLDDYEYKKSIMAVYDSVLYRSKRIYGSRKEYRFECTAEYLCDGCGGNG